MSGKKNVLMLLVVLMSSALVNAVPATFISPGQITGAPFSITAPGLYVLTDDTTFSPGAAATAITISSNNVTLDLNGKCLIGGNANANHGIELPANRNNIIIKNGYVTDFVGIGIKADAGTTYTIITLQDLTIKNRNKTGLCISFAHASDCFVTRCQCSGANIGASFDDSSRFQLRDSTFSNNASIGLFLSSSKNFKITTCQANDMAGSGATGVSIDLCNNCIFQSCIFNGNVSTNGSIGLGSFTSNSNSISFFDCQFCQNRNISTGDAAGLDVQASSGCVVKNCLLSNNNTGAGITSGIIFPASSHGNYCESCIVSDNFSSGAGAVNGFNLVATTSNNYFVDCTALRNRSGSGSSRGFSIASGNVGNIFKNCQAYDNTGGGANSGFFDGNATAVNWYAGNLAFGQGANNYVGASTGFVTVNVAAQPPQGSFDERSIDNISVV